MALFRRSGGFDDLAQKLQNPAALAPSEIDDLIAEVLAHPDATPRKLSWMLAADHPKVREHGFDYLARWSSKECGDLLLKTISTAPVARRRELSLLMLKLERTQVAETLRRAFITQGRDGRGLVLDVLAVGLPLDDHVGLLKEAIKLDNPVPVRLQAARLMRKLHQVPSVGLLLRNLIHDDEADVRAEAIQALCLHPTPDIVEPFCTQLASEDRGTRAAMIDALARLAAEHGAQMEEPLFTVLADECDETRTMAAQLLIKLPDTRRVVRDFLLHARGLAPWLRERAITAMLSIADQLAGPLAELISDPDADVRTAAMLLAARWEHPSIVPSVMRVFSQSDDWWTASLAADILARFPQPQVLTTLLGRLDDPDLRFSVTGALAAFPQPEATATLSRLVGDDDPSIRAAAVTGLARRGDPAVAKLLFEVATSDLVLRVRDAATTALETLGDVAAPLLAQVRAAETPEEQADTGDGITLEMANDELNAPGTPEPVQAVAAASAPPPPPPTRTSAPPARPAAAPRPTAPRPMAPRGPAPAPRPRPGGAPPWKPRG